MIIRSLCEEEWDLVANLIFHSTNDWYQRNLNRGCFPGDDPLTCRIFPEVYEALDPGCCLVAEIEGEIAGSCFYHPRESHVSLGIMNASPKFSGQGVARRLLAEVVRKAGGLPVRLVSSAMNLDSYSLYTRMGFVPTALYQDMYFPEGKSIPRSSLKVRPAVLEDVHGMVRLEEAVSGIRRGKDFVHFVENNSGIWKGYVHERGGEIAGFLFSVNHPGSQMLGPGVMRDDEVALALIAEAVSGHEGGSPLMLIPAESGIVKELYRWGARNCELHVSQVLGAGSGKPDGVVLPTFMPETG
ncbi:GNAT family N-acetyltransferase [Akkermansiaceae bacterium]|nr:GNAT family N-acetyltransferase [Akkermansiaceae bacterium]